MANFLQEMMRDARDVRVLMKEILIVVWRLNSVGIAAHLFIEALNSLDKYTENSYRAALIGDVIQAIELPELSQYVSDVKSTIVSFFDESMADLIKVPLGVYPDVAGCIDERLRPLVVDVSPVFGSLAEEAICKHQSAYTQLNCHFRQLREFFPRYYELMNRSIVADRIVGFAAGFFGGQFGVVSTKIWEGWRYSSDRDFLNKFGSAIDNFVQTCVKFQEGGENSLSIVFDRLLDEFENVENVLFDIYRELEANGKDIKPLYEKHRELPKELDQDTKQLLQIAISNLSENRAISTRQLANIHKMVKW